MLTIKNIFFIFIMGTLLTACGSDRAAGEHNSSKGVLGVVESDSDGDGISDADEVNIYGTNPDSNDTDNDGLLDGLEINTYDTNATNPDTDGDCLLDSFEVLNYETNATNVDSDGDGVNDGIEIYTYTEELNSSCLTTPETFSAGANSTPAKDNIPNDGTDVINALDPKNHTDSDGDGLLDSEELFYGTNPDSNDSDNDGLLDSDEINSYDTNATNADTDNDGLLDGLEIHTYETNATNSDTDGDCLLDSFEILNYETNATNVDSDGDGVNDGIEIYTYTKELNNSCLTTPETLVGGVNSTPAKDNIPNDGTDVINALDPTNHTDSDGDGLLDSEELFYGTNPDSNDTDNDGLLDIDEINSYDTNATNADTDNDGLLDGLEINTYETNATNSDTDGDCLLDSFEVLNYETNASNADTDSDGVEDGLEIYGDLNAPCIDTPETLLDEPNSSPANDNLPAGSTLIDALDPTNDSDGDYQANIKELECAEGNPKDKTKVCLMIDETEEGSAMASAGFVYVPGGFDVDKDGINEKGFWVSAWQARKKLGADNVIPFSTVNEKVGPFNTYIQNNFFMINATDVISPIIHGYSADTLQETLDKGYPEGYQLEFSLNLNPKGKVRLSGETPFMAALELSMYEFHDSNGELISKKLQMPSLKQYAHIQQLLKADKENGGNGNTIRNGLLGTDTNVPLLFYAKVMHEFGEPYKEFLSSIMQMKEGNVIMCTGCPWVRDWMGIDKDKLYKNPNEGTLAKGAAATLDVGMGVGATKDDYAVLVRAGEVMDLKHGVAGATSDTDGTTDGVGFRAATDYLE